MTTPTQWLNQGWALHQQKKLDQAEALYRQALAAEPKNANAYCYLGILLHDRNQFQASIAAYQEAIKIQSQFPIAWNNLGNSLRQAGQPEAAEIAFQQALTQKPDYVNAHKNRGTLHVWEGRIELGQECYQQALQYGPGDAEVIRNMGIIQLLQGNYTEGWGNYAKRWNLGDLNRPSFPAPIWRGENPKGKTFFLYPEQGLGDTVQFIRVAKWLKDRGARTIVQCQPALVPLLKSCAGIDQLIAQPQVPMTSVDYQASFIDVAAQLIPSYEAIPKQDSYLSVPQNLIDLWGKHLSQFPDTPRIALAWQGNPQHSADSFRSAPFAALQPLGQVRGVHWISLQLDATAAQLSDWRGYDPVMVIDGNIDKQHGAFMDTAAILHHVDLLISVDSSVAHIAGALGVPVWLALGNVPDWRWKLEGNQSSWYPNHLLFRQRKTREWQSVFESMRDTLASQFQTLNKNRGTP
ncbi:MAG: hypothetical protein RLY14_742 [Planctomycetota bacterium]|jgi:Flp pilus assembly protein TadD